MTIGYFRNTGSPVRTIVLLLAAVASGCLSRSPDVRTFTLGATPRAVDAAVTSEVGVLLTPIHLPRYLERSQFVRRMAGNELEVDEFNRWADSFEENVLRALTLQVERRLESDRVTSAASGQRFDYVVRVDFDELVVGPDDVLRMRTRWTIQPTEDGSDQTARRTDRDQPLADPSAESRVAAHEVALEALGDALAEEILKLEEATDEAAPAGIGEGD